MRSIRRRERIPVDRNILPAGSNRPGSGSQEYGSTWNMIAAGRNEPGSRWNIVDSSSQGVAAGSHRLHSGCPTLPGSCPEPSGSSHRPGSMSQEYGSTSQGSVADYEQIPACAGMTVSYPPGGEVSRPVAECRVSDVSRPGLPGDRSVPGLSQSPRTPREGLQRRQRRSGKPGPVRGTVYNHCRVTAKTIFENN